MEDAFAQLTAGFMLIVGLAVVFSKYFAQPQVYITEAIKTGLKVPKRYAMLLNLGVGVLLCVLVTVVVSFWLPGGWKLIPAGLFAGVILSKESGEEYDRQVKAGEPPAVEVKPADTRPIANRYLP